MFQLKVYVNVLINSILYYQLKLIADLSLIFYKIYEFYIFSKIYTIKFRRKIYCI